VRGPERIDPVRIHVAKKDELPDQPLDQWTDCVVVEAVPFVVGGAQGQVNVATGLGVVLVVSLEHAPPLLVVDSLGCSPAAVHRDDQRPTIRRLLADMPPQVRAFPVLGRDDLGLELAAERIVSR